MSWAFTPGSYSGGATAPTWTDGVTIPLAADYKAIANDIQHWGGNVDAGGNYLVNCQGVQGPTGANPIIFQTNGSERARITSTGGVGIGTTAPLGLLHIQAASNVSITLGDSAGTLTAGGLWRLVTGGASNFLALQLNTSGAGNFATSSTILQIAPNGSLGIGAAPIGNLHVQSNSNTTIVIDDVAGTLTAGGLWRWSTAGASNFIVLQMNTSVSGNFSTATNAFAILANGNVGIGTASPTSPLQVIGLPTYASDAAAGTGGLTSGAFYKDSGGGLHVKL